MNILHDLLAKALTPAILIHAQVVNVDFRMVGNYRVIFIDFHLTKAITNHFFHGNSAIDRNNTTWREFVQPYIDAYYEACDEGAKLDFDVIFGIEEGVGDSKEMLCYGIDLDYLLHCEDMKYVHRKEFVDLVHAGGGIVIQAHPFRFAEYMRRYVDPFFDDCDGIEVFNGNNRPQDANEKALNAALSQDRPMILTAGSDCHSCAGISNVGLLLPERVEHL